MMLEFAENIGGTKLLDAAMVAWYEMVKEFPTIHKPLESESGFYALNESGDIVSFALLFETEESELVISLAWTRPDYRKKGLYRSLIEVIKRWAHNQGIAKIVAGVHIENADSIAVHERLGMKPQAIWFQMEVAS